MDRVTLEKGIDSYDSFVGGRSVVDYRNPDEIGDESCPQLLWEYYNPRSPHPNSQDISASFKKVFKSPSLYPFLKGIFTFQQNLVQNYHDTKALDQLGNPALEKVLLDRDIDRVLGYMVSSGIRIERCDLSQNVPLIALYLRLAHQDIRSCVLKNHLKSELIKTFGSVAQSARMEQHAHLIALLSSEGLKALELPSKSDIPHEGILYAVYQYLLSNDDHSFLKMTEVSPHIIQKHVLAIIDSLVTQEDPELTLAKDWSLAFKERFLQPMLVSLALIVPTALVLPKDTDGVESNPLAAEREKEFHRYYKALYLSVIPYCHTVKMLKDFMSVLKRWMEKQDHLPVKIYSMNHLLKLLKEEGPKESAFYEIYESAKKEVAWIDLLDEEQAISMHDSVYREAILSSDIEPSPSPTAHTGMHTPGYQVLRQATRSESSRRSSHEPLSRLAHLGSNPGMG
jgi:hypothetical protein